MRSLPWVFWESSSHEFCRRHRYRYPTPSLPLYLPPFLTHSCYRRCMRQRRQAGNSPSSKAKFLSVDMSNADTIELPEEGGVRMPLPKFALSELKVGKVIGMGGFSSVSAINSIELDEVYDLSDDDTAHRKEFAATANKPNGNGGDGNGDGGVYVLKTLRDDLAEDEHIKGVVDLAIEADFLSVLSHPNIISMRALANSDPHESRFFVILDRLSVTLERKFNYWRKVVGENAGYWLPCCGYCCANSLALHAVWKERMTVALDMAKAIKYLHDSGIIYRDLKPDNIGFAESGQLKLFDFGLAKRLEGVEKTRGGFYNLTGNTGSLRYMAPEVANDEPYDLTADTYSFGIIFWQTCSLQTPFSGMSQKQHAEKVVRKGERPKSDPSWPMSWVSLMDECWNKDKTTRPTFEYITTMLEESLNELVQDEGVVPTRASEIRAKKRKKKATSADQRLDVDTRLSTDNDTNVKRFESEII